MPCGTDAAVLLMQDDHARVLLREFVADSAAPVRASVINQQDLEIRIALDLQAADTGLQVRCNIVYRDDDRNGRTPAHVLNAFPNRRKIHFTGRKTTSPTRYVLVSFM